MSPKKMCYYALKDSCNNPDTCTYEHPEHAHEARIAYRAMPRKSLSICSFYPTCERINCTYLHAGIQPRAPLDTRSSTLTIPLPAIQPVTDSTSQMCMRALVAAISATDAFRQAQFVNDPDLDVYQHECRMSQAVLRRCNTASPVVKESESEESGSDEYSD